MSGQPWLSPGFLLSLLAALLLMITVSCGTSATATPEPEPDAEETATATPAPDAEETAAATPEPDAEETAAATPEPDAEETATATPAPTPEATTAAATEAPEGEAEPYGTLTTSFQALQAYGPHTRYRPGTSAGNIAMAGHEGLFRLDKDSIYRGLMVKEWSVAPDNRTWTFKLHEGIRFHGDWGPMTPEDVINSVRELGGDDGSCGCAQIQDIFDNPDGYWKALDDYTLELDTVIPAPDVLTWIDFPAQNSAWIFSKTQWESLLEDGASQNEALPHLVGTGPWELVDLQQSESMTFAAVRNHWRKTPEFATLVLLAIPEEATALANFQTNRIDTWSATPDSLPEVSKLETTKFMSLKGAGEMNLIIWQNGYTFVGTDRQWPGYDPDLPWIGSDPDLDSEGWEQARKVREAIGLAIDRQKIVDELLHGEGEPSATYGWVPFKSQWPEGWEWSYDPDRARQLLEEAGYPDGFDISISTASSTAASISETACVAIAGMLQDVGINAVLKNVPIGELYDGYKARTQEGITCQHINNFGGEPLSLHRISYDPELLWGVGWDHPWFTERMNAAYSTFDFDDRWEIQLEMGQWMRDNGMGIGVYGQNQVFPLGPQVDSWEEHLSLGMAQSISALEYAPHRK